MGSEQELGPFQDKILEYGVQSWDNIPDGLIARIVTGVDCIKYHEEFLAFVTKYADKIRGNVELMLSIMRMCIVIEDINKLNLSNIINELANDYQSTILRCPIDGLDVDISFNFLRLFLEYGISSDMLITALSLRIMSVKDELHASDCHRVIINHGDVLEKIYENEQLSEYGYVLDNSINRSLKRLLE